MASDTASASLLLWRRCREAADEALSCLVASLNRRYACPMQPITSLQNPIVKMLRTLADKKGRREHGLFLAEGLQMLERAEAMGWTPEHVVATKTVSLFESVRPLIISEKLMAELSAQNNPHEVLASFRARFQPHPGKTGVWLALEDIRDPGNLGTILRTADAAGASGIILAGECCDPHAPDCVRASTGSIFAVPLVRMGRDALIDFMRGFPGETVGTAMAAKQDYRRPYATPTLLLMGSESRGLSPALSEACKVKVRIPMKPGVESLNVATAAALMLYQATAA
jgi:RNA methyltransferase, TrmH family